MALRQVTDDSHHLMRLLFFVENIYDDFVKEKNEIGALTFTQLRPNTVVLTEMGPYISPELRKMINKLTFQNVELNYSYCGIQVSIKIYKQSSYSSRKVKTLLELINFMIFYCRKVNVSFKDKLTIKLVLSPFKKELSDVLCAFNVNSGFTSKDYVNGLSSIVVYREEEAAKVLIHELLHAFEIDCKTLMSDDEQRFAELFGMYSGVKINESFTDAYACLLNVVYCSLVLSRLHGEAHQNIIKQFVNFERMHIVKIGQRVWLKVSNQRKEKTNVIAYYVIKALIWSNIEGFCKYMGDHQFKIGSCKDFAKYLYGETKRMNISQNNDFMTNLYREVSSNEKISNNAVNKHVKKVKLNSIRMSSIDIL